MRIEMNSFSVTVQKKQIKNINLRISRAGEVQLSAPIKTPMSVIYSFLQEKRSWIEMHRLRLQHSNKQMPKHLNTGEYLLFQGIPYELMVRETDATAYVELEDNQLCLFVPPRVTSTFKEELVRQWYYAQMQQCLPPLFDKWQAIMKVSVNKITIKRMTSSWGSCHPIKKYITLNLRLIEKPLICLEYVIVHELVHLFEASHNQRFHALMSHYLPNWKEIKKQLI